MFIHQRPYFFSLPFLLVVSLKSIGETNKQADTSRNSSNSLEDFPPAHLRGNLLSSLMHQAQTTVRFICSSKRANESQDPCNSRVYFRHPLSGTQPSLMLPSFLLLQNTACLKEQNHSSAVMLGQTAPAH